ncbi:MAG: serine/threonine protein kinase [Planctomycetia bacterium]|nr:serine/threonine protein kinase [Planctomycetia bacterium]
MPTDHAADDRDERLAALLDELFAARQRGEAVDIERAVVDQPELAPELRELWAAAGLADWVGSQPTNGFTTTAPVPDEFHTARALPWTFGDYELLEELGRGGMGIVYRARQISLGRIVAVKMVLRGPLAGSDDLARFRLEAAAAAQLNHPLIVPVYEVGEQEGHAYFSMQYVEGRTLSARLAEGPLAPPEAARLLAEVARAIHAAHLAGVLHRDIKPSNIIIDLEGRPHMTDFGLAKRVADLTDATAAESLTRSGAILGTPAYMSPEQAGGRGELGPAADVYSLGAVLYQMLTGRPPLVGATPLETVMLVLEQDPVSPRLLSPRTDRQLEWITLKCLQKPPELRYASAAALADDLGAWLAGEPVSAASGRFSAVLARWFRETHHVGVLENWGLLWMWHAVVLLALCVVTNLLHAGGVESPAAYLLLWGGGVGVWAPIFWALRHRSGPVTFVERQVAHVWAGSVIASVGLFGVEWILGLPVLTLSPVLGLVNGMVFAIKAGILSGEFYIHAAVLYLTAVAMAAIAYLHKYHGLPDFGITLFGVVSAAVFFIPGLKYYRRRMAG